MSSFAWKSSSRVRRSLLSFRLIEGPILYNMSASTLGRGRTLGGGRDLRTRVLTLASRAEASGGPSSTDDAGGCGSSPTPEISLFEQNALDETTWVSAEGGGGE